MSDEKKSQGRGRRAKEGQRPGKAVSVQICSWRSVWGCAAKATAVQPLRGPGSCRRNPSRHPNRWIYCFWSYWEIRGLESISDPREPVRLISQCSSLPQHDVDAKDWAVDGESILVVRTPRELSLIKGARAVPVAAVIKHASHKVRGLPGRACML